MRYLNLMICLAVLSACGGEPPQSSEASTTDDVLFQDQRNALQKAKGVEDVLQEADAKRRAQMEAQQ